MGQWGLQQRTRKDKAALVATGAHFLLRRGLCARHRCRALQFLIVQQQLLTFQSVRASQPGLCDCRVGREFAFFGARDSEANLGPSLGHSLSEASAVDLGDGV